jgi:hypothetical protein
MTADQIRAQKFECDDGAYGSARWLQEVAAQLAELNEKVSQIVKPETEEEFGGLRLSEPVATRQW